MRAAIVLVLAGCFGEGPSPGTPSAVKVVFALDLSPINDASCEPRPFIGGVAIGPGEFGYVVEEAFNPACSNPGQMGLLTSSVYQFKKTGGATMKIGEAGTVQEGGGGKPKIGAGPLGPVWLFTDMAFAGQIEVQSQTGAISGRVTPPGGAPIAASIIVEDTRTIVASMGDAGGQRNILSPRYPCCGSGGTGSQGNALFELSNTAPTSLTVLAGAGSYVPEQVKEVMVANSSTLFFFHVEAGFHVRGVPSSGGTPFEIAALPNDAHPAGLAADDARVAWATSTDIPKSGTRVACSIFVADATALPSEPTLLFSTKEWSCTDVVLDGDFVYFPIVDVVSLGIDNILRSKGLGRIDVVTRTLETIELGIYGPEAAPRQLHVDGDDLLLVAPFAIARIAKTELVGKHEIDP